MCASIASLKSSSATVLHWVFIYNNNNTQENSSFVSSFPSTRVRGEKSSFIFQIYRSVQLIICFSTLHCMYKTALPVKQTENPRVRTCTYNCDRLRECIRSLSSFITERARERKAMKARKSAKSARDFLFSQQDLQGNLGDIGWIG